MISVGDNAWFVEAGTVVHMRVTERSVCLIKADRWYHAEDVFSDRDAATAAARAWTKARVG